MIFKDLYTVSQNLQQIMQRLAQVPLSIGNSIFRVRISHSIPSRLIDESSPNINQAFKRISNFSKSYIII